MKHQQIISTIYIFIIQSYDGILLYHEMGTGKTCSALGPVEKIIKDKNSPYNNVLILAKGDIIINNIYRELGKVCTDGIYIDDDKKVTIDEDEDKKRGDSEVKSVKKKYQRSL